MKGMMYVIPFFCPQTGRVTMEKHVIRFIDKFRPWSYSKLKQVENCPYQFFQRYKGNRPPKGFNENTSHGLIAHDFLDLVFKKKLSIDDYYDFVEESKIPTFVKERLHGQIDEIEKLYDNVFKTIKKHLISKDKKIRLYSELTLKINNKFELDSKEKNPLFKAIIDVMSFDAETVLIIDHKSNGSKKELFIDQMEFYALLTSFCCTKQKDVRCFIADIKTGEVTQVLHRSLDYYHNEGKNNFLKKFHNLVAPFQELSQNYFPPIKSKTCKWCYLQSECPLFVS